MNAKDKVDIKPSKKGKVVSQKDYDETVVKKMEEFREMNRGRSSDQHKQLEGRSSASKFYLF